MPVRVRLPGLLRGATGGAVEVDLEASTVGDLIAALDLRHPGMGDALLDDSGLRRYWCVYVNGRDCRRIGGLATPVANGDRAWILPTTSGGMFAPTVPPVPTVPPAGSAP
jgi:molybdopterin converting factor small subunit